MRLFISEFQESLATTLAWSMLGACLPHLIFFEVYTLFLAEVSQPETRSMPFYWLTYVGATFFFVSIIAWCLNRILALLVFSVWAIFSIWSLKLAFLPQFFELHGYIQVVSGILALVVVFLVVKRVSQSGPWAAIGLGFAALLLFFAVPNLSSHDIGNHSEATRDIAIGQPPETEANILQTANFPAFSNIQFKTRPNFYIFLYDSLIPPEVADLFFGPGAAGYAADLSKHFIRPSGVTAQNNVPSKPSIREIMWLGVPPSDNSNWQYFTGVFDSPLSSLFRANGYQITTGYTTTKWGEAGDYINDHLYLASAPQQLQETTLCIDNGSSLMNQLSAFGMCKIIGRLASMPSLKKMLATLASDDQKSDVPNASWHRAVDNQIRLNASSDAPQLTFLYTFTPVGHTKKSYHHDSVSDRSEYIGHFKEKSLLAGLVIRSLVETIQETDKGAVVIVAGDHGTFISRRGSAATNFRGGNVYFSLVDRHMVALGLMRTEHKCVEQQERDGFIPNQRGYHTVSSVVISVLSCLADDESLAQRLPSPPYESLNDEMRKIPSDADLTKFIHSHLSEELRMTFPSKDQ